jgi:hypothetical protein
VKNHCCTSYSGQMRVDLEWRFLQLAWPKLKSECRPFSWSFGMTFPETRPKHNKFFWFLEIFLWEKGVERNRRYNIYGLRMVKTLKLCYIYFLYIDLLEITLHFITSRFTKSTTQQSPRVFFPSNRNILAPTFLDKKRPSHYLWRHPPCRIPWIYRVLYFI